MMGREEERSGSYVLPGMHRRQAMVRFTTARRPHSQLRLTTGERWEGEEEMMGRWKRRQRMNTDLLQHRCKLPPIDNNQRVTNSLMSTSWSYHPRTWVECDKPLVQILHCFCGPRCRMRSYFDFLFANVYTPQYMSGSLNE